MGTICQKYTRNPKVLFEIKKVKQRSGLPALNFEEIREQGLILPTKKSEKFPDFGSNF